MIARARAVYYGGMTTLFLAGSEHHEPQDLQGGRRQVLSCQRPGRALGRESINEMVDKYKWNRFKIMNATVVLS
jgi:hypothetical protein